MYICLKPQNFGGVDFIKGDEIPAGSLVPNRIPRLIKMSIISFVPDPVLPQIEPEKPQSENAEQPPVETKTSDDANIQPPGNPETASTPAGTSAENPVTDGEKGASQESVTGTEAKEAPVVTGTESAAEQKPETGKGKKAEK